jgi:hypothetical protein
MRTRRSRTRRTTRKYWKDYIDIDK